MSDQEGFIIEGDLFIIPHENNPSIFGQGNVNVNGELKSNIIKERTLNSGVKVYNVNQIELKQNAVADNPSVGSYTMYLDVDNKVKVKNNSGNVDIGSFIPLTSKGQMLTHNGTNTVVLNPGSDNQVLVYDNTQPNGVKWINSSSIITGSSGKSNVIHIADNKKVSIVDNISGVFYVSIYNKIQNGSVSNFITIKRNDSLYGVSTNFSKCNFPENFKLYWEPYEEIMVSKNGSTLDGLYYIQEYPQNNDNKTVISLTGTNWVNVSSDTTGSNIFFIENNISGPVGIIYVSKNLETNSTCAIFKSGITPGINNSKLNIRWNASSGVELQKNNSLDDGNYTLTNLKSEMTLLSTITLTGTTEQTLLQSYSKDAKILIIESDVSGGMTAIFVIGKNKPGGILSVSKISESRSTSTKLKLNWGVNSYLTIQKTGNDYNGQYRVYIL